MTKALITGIKGFAASHLAELLLANGYHVVGFDLSLDGAANIEHIRERLELCECDLRNSARVNEVISQTEPDEIYHLAAIAHVPTSYRDVRLTFDVNFYGTLNLFEAVKATTRDIKVLYVGSASEYGIVKETQIPISEDVPLAPVDPYGVSKASADMLAYQYHRNFGLHIVRVRPFNHIGPRQSADYVVSSFARQIADIEKGIKEPVITVGNLEVRRDLTDVRDMVSAYWLAVREGRAGDVYNVCSEKAFSIREISDRLLAMTSNKISVLRDPQKLRSSDVLLVLGDCSRFREQTGWRAETSLDTVLSDTLEYWRQTASEIQAKRSTPG